MRKKLFAYALSGALTLGAIGGTITYAAESTGTTTPSTEAKERNGHGFEEWDEATKTKVQEIQNRVAEELEALGVTVPEKGEKQDLFANLDEATKTKAQAILKQLKEDTLTREEAQEQLEALGAALPEKREKQDLFSNLDEDAKAKAEAIRDQEKAGTITHEEARTQLEALGVSLPEKREKQDLFADLDEATKEKAQAIVDEAEAELAELGVDRPVLGKGQHHGMGRK
ncbi:hypothetical protein [Planomicrobium sp. CPCC 101079]|uniref:hypothetical protein n=1 Tax=Planomicrobium sp. CPCC 101079 TaxID=2599618 RepID=UPI0011B391AA|nr:hypothetical protein [Planomicrobium sp. CPCC 101079]TWT01808.1 hypothetical protein FQV28_14320 [Planomicrobium sp. CPCC 101079]